MFSLTTSRLYEGTATISSTTLPATDILRALHDPQFLISLNPTVHSAVVNGKDNSTWHITYRIVLFGFIPVYTKCIARFTPVIDGMDVLVLAGGGTRTTSQWRVHGADANGNMRVTEDCMVKTFFIFGPYVRKMHGSAHNKMMKTLPDLVQKWRANQRGM